MLTLKQILIQVCLGDWFLSVDLKNAYFHFQIAIQIVPEIRGDGSPIIQSVPSSAHFYEMRVCGPLPPETDGSAHPELPRPLSTFSPIERSAMRTQILAPQPLGKSGVQDQPKQKPSVPQPTHLVPGGSIQFVPNI